MENKTILFVKFGEKKYIKRLFDGKLYFSHADRFRNIEKKNGLKGQGDAFEAILQLKNGQAILINQGAGHGALWPNVNINLSLGDTVNIPVFCLTYITDADCAIESVGGKNILKVNEEIKATIKQHFPKADTAGVFFNPIQFTKCIEQLGIVVHDNVQYYDFSPKGTIVELIDYITKFPGEITKTNQLFASMTLELDSGSRRHLELTTHNINRILFCKDSFFEEEKEYRFILPNKRISEPQDFYVRWFSQKKKMLTLDEFFSGIEL